jgi:hypothetical protein
MVRLRAGPIQGGGNEGMVQDMSEVEDSPILKDRPGLLVDICQVIGQAQPMIIMECLVQGKSDLVCSQSHATLVHSELPLGDQHRLQAPGKGLSKLREFKHRLLTACSAYYYYFPYMAAIGLADFVD